MARIVVNVGAAELRLVDIAVLPEARGSGIGTRTLRALQRCAADQGLALTLSVHHSNPNARRLYQAMGFRTRTRDDMAEQMIWNNGPAD